MTLGRAEQCAVACQQCLCTKVSILKFLRSALLITVLLRSVPLLCLISSACLVAYLVRAVCSLFVPVRVQDAQKRLFL